MVQISILDILKSKEPGSLSTLNTPEQVDPTAESTAKSKEEITDEVLIHTDSIAKFQNTPFAVKGRGKMIGSKSWECAWIWTG